jgi:rhodanese-related sulfurtransferase
MKLALLVSLLFLAAGTGCSRAAEAPTITPAEAAQHVAAGKAVLIDVREPKEWAETGVAAPAALLALSDLNGDRKQWKEFLEKNRDKELILYCRSGTRSGRAAKLLAEEGYRTLNAGGFHDWQAAGLPTRKLDPPPKP